MITVDNLGPYTYHFVVATSLNQFKIGNKDEPNSRNQLMS